MTGILAPEFFDEAWFQVQPHRYTPDETAAHVAGVLALLGLQPGQRVLDVPVGTGRVAVPLAEAGLDVTGVDLHAAPLSLARQAAAEAGVPIELHQRDMRDLPWEGRFDAVLNLWGSFGYFDDAGNLAFATAARRALNPGGQLLIEGPGAEGLFTSWAPRRWSRWGEVLVTEEASYEPATGVVTSVWTFVHQGRELVRTWRMRVYSAAELAGLLRAAGFSEVRFYGSWDGAALKIGSPRTIAVARV